MIHREMRKWWKAIQKRVETENHEINVMEVGNIADTQHKIAERRTECLKHIYLYTIHYPTLALNEVQLYIKFGDESLWFLC